MKRFLPVALLIPLLLAGCTSGGTQDYGSGLSLTDQHRGQARADLGGNGFTSGPYAFWTTKDKKTVTLTTYGSGSCPVVPDGLTVASATRVVLPVKKYSGACTADLTAYTVTFAVPAKVSRSQVVKLVLEQKLATTTETSVVLQPTLTLDTLPVTTSPTATPVAPSSAPVLK